MKNFKIKRLPKTLILVITMISCLLMSTVCFADTNITKNAEETNANEITSIKAQSSSIATDEVTLTDDNTISDTLSSAKKYDINVSDSAERYFQIVTNKPVQVTLTSQTYPSLVYYTLGASRISCFFAWHFVAGANYQLTVTPDGSNTAVSVNMSKSGSMRGCYVNYGVQNIEEENMLPGQQTEEYMLGFEKAGTYTVIVTSNIGGVTTSLVRPGMTKPDDYKFTGAGSHTFASFSITDPYGTEGAQNQYVLDVTNTNSASSTYGYYTVTVLKQ